MPMIEKSGKAKGRYCGDLFERKREVEKKKQKTLIGVENKKSILYIRTFLYRADLTGTRERDFHQC